MEDPRELLSDGIAALRAKDLRQAEMFFLEACQAYARKGRKLSSQEFAYHKAACYGLGRVYRLTGRYELAVVILERALPNPVAFKDLVNTFRALAQLAEKSGDEHARAAWYHRMYSLARIHSVVTSMHSPQRPQAMDWPLAAKWIDELRDRHGTIYAFRFDGPKLPDDALLNSDDYKSMELCRRAAETSITDSALQPTIPWEFGPPADDLVPPEIDLGLERDLSWSTKSAVSETV